MNNAKIIGWGLIVPWVIAALTEMGMFNYDGGYMVAGLGMLVFGLWGGIVLINYKKD